MHVLSDLHVDQYSTTGATRTGAASTSTSVQKSTPASANYCATWPLILPIVLHRVLNVRLHGGLYSVQPVLQ